jgi:hypothetical protein
MEAYAWVRGYVGLGLKFNPLSHLHTRVCIHSHSFMPSLSVTLCQSVTLSLSHPIGHRTNINTQRNSRKRNARCYVVNLVFLLRMKRIAVTVAKTRVVVTKRYIMFVVFMLIVSCCSSCCSYSSDCCLYGDSM